RRGEARGCRRRRGGAVGDGRPLRRHGQLHAGLLPGRRRLRGIGAGDLARGAAQGTRRHRLRRAARIACQSVYGVAGRGRSVTPSGRSASVMALATTAGAGVVPPSPPAFTPSGLVGEGTSLRRVTKDGTSEARGTAECISAPGSGRRS